MGFVSAELRKGFIWYLYELGPAAWRKESGGGLEEIPMESYPGQQPSLVGGLCQSVHSIHQPVQVTLMTSGSFVRKGLMMVACKYVEWTKGWASYLRWTSSR